jgi:cell wall-associated NlpC family hydrolase
VSEHTRAGRHRRAVRHSPVAELSAIARSAGQSGIRLSAVLAASGGLVATFALPTQAPAHAVAAPSVRALTTAPAVVAPTAPAPEAQPAVGVAGVRAVAAPKPRPAAVAAVAERTHPRSASRSAQRAAVADVEQSSSRVVTIARTLLGIPYASGGTSPSTGFDCSGFTQYVFGTAGISLPRTAAQQQSAATPVSDPQPGDLVFFGSPAWHVGIYTGHGMMIDSPKPGRSTSERPVFSGVSGYGRF